VNGGNVETVTGRSGRAAARHADPRAGSLLATSRLSTVQLPSMAGVGATQAIRQAILAAWKSAIPARHGHPIAAADQ